MTKNEEIQMLSNELIRCYRNFMVADRLWWRSSNISYTFIRDRLKDRYTRCYNALLRRGLDGVSIRGLTFNLEF